MRLQTDASDADEGQMIQSQGLKGTGKGHLPQKAILHLPTLFRRCNRQNRRLARMESVSCTDEMLAWEGISQGSLHNGVHGPEATVPTGQS